MTETVTNSPKNVNPSPANTKLALQQTFQEGRVTHVAVTDTTPKYILSVRPDKDSQRFTIHREDSGQLAGHIIWSEQTFFEVELFEGKGGSVLILKGDPEKKLPVIFMLPGSAIQTKLLSVNFSGDPIQPNLETKPTQQQSPTPQQTIRQAMVLGAGIGTRILPLTRDDNRLNLHLAKPSLPFGEETVIGLLVQQLAKHGITHFFVNTFYQSESVSNALQQAKEKLAKVGLPITITEIKEDRATGTAGGLNTMLDNPSAYGFNAEEPLLIVQGDAVTNANFSDLITHHQAQNAALTIGCQCVPDHLVSKFGIIAVEDIEAAACPTSSGSSGVISHFIEKPSLEEAGPHRLGSTGFYVLDPCLYPILKAVHQKKCEQKPADQVELDFAKDLFSEVLSRRKANHPSLQGKTMWADDVPGYWSDIGNPVQYIQTLKEVYEGCLGEPSLEAAGTTLYDKQTGVLYWPGAVGLMPETVRLMGNIIITPTLPKA